MLISEPLFLSLLGKASTRTPDDVNHAKYRMSIPREWFTANRGVNSDKVNILTHNRLERQTCLYRRASRNPVSQDIPQDNLSHGNAQSCAPQGFFFSIHAIDGAHPSISSSLYTNTSCLDIHNPDACPSLPHKHQKRNANKLQVERSGVCKKSTTSLPPFPLSSQHTHTHPTAPWK